MKKSSEVKKRMFSNLNNAILCFFKNQKSDHSLACIYNNQAKILVDTFYGYQLEFLLSDFLSDFQFDKNGFELIDFYQYENQVICLKSQIRQFLKNEKYHDLIQVFKDIELY